MHLITRGNQMTVFYKNEGEFEQWVLEHPRGVLIRIKNLIRQAKFNIARSELIMSKKIIKKLNLQDLKTKVENIEDYLAQELKRKKELEELKSRPKPPELKLSEVYIKWKNSQNSLNLLKEKIKDFHDKACKSLEVMILYESLKKSDDKFTVELVHYIEDLYSKKFNVIPQEAMILAKFYRGVGSIVDKKNKWKVDPKSFIMYSTYQRRISAITIKGYPFKPILESLSQLKKIHVIYSDEKNNYDSITKYEDLEVLKIEDHSIEEMERLRFLKSMKNLRKLRLSCEYLKKVKFPKNLSNLEELILDNCSLERIEGFENLTNLRKLTLKRQLITQIEGLDTLQNLEFLDLSDNRITEIKRLENLKNLKTIILKNNEIEELNGNSLNRFNVII